MSRRRIAGSHLGTVKAAVTAEQVGKYACEITGGQGLNIRND
jgi:hypothetical protein